MYTHTSYGCEEEIDGIRACMWIGCERVYFFLGERLKFERIRKEREEEGIKDTFPA